MAAAAGAAALRARGSGWTRRLERLGRAGSAHRRPDLGEPGGARGADPRGGAAGHDRDRRAGRRGL